MPEVAVEAGRAAGFEQEGDSSLGFLQHILAGVGAQGKLVLEAVQGDVAGVPGCGRFGAGNVVLGGGAGGHFRVSLWVKTKRALPVKRAPWWRGVSLDIGSVTAVLVLAGRLLAETLGAF